MQFNDLPIEVFERIMRYLDFQSLSTMFRVSSRYRDIIAKNSINILDFINPTYDIEGYSEKKLSLGMLKLLRYILPIPIMKGLLNDAWNITQGKIGRLSIHDVSIVNMSLPIAAGFIHFDVILKNILEGNQKNYIFKGEFYVERGKLKKAVFTYHPDELKFDMIRMIVYKPTFVDYIKYDAQVFVSDMRDYVINHHYNQKKGIVIPGIPYEPLVATL